MDGHPLLRFAEPLPEAMFLVRIDGELVAANAAGRRLVDRATPTADANNLCALVADAPEKVRRYLRQCFRCGQPLVGALTWRFGQEQETYHCEGALVQPASEEGPSLAILRCRPRREHVSRFLTLNRKVEALSREVHERMRMEAHLRRLATIVTSTQDAIYVADPSGVVLEWNSGAERVYGYSAEEMVGRSIKLLLPPEGPHDILSLLDRAAAGQDVQQYETLRMTKDGRRIDVSVTITPLLNAVGRVEAFAFISRDITRRVRLERELQHYAEQVQTQAAEMEAQNEELQVQNEEMAAQDRHRNEFLAMLAHELRNPLAPIVAAAEVLRLQGGDPAALKRHTEVIARQVRHLQRMVDDLLDVSRITQGKIVLRKEPVDLTVAVEQAIQICAPLIEVRQHELLVSMPSELVRIEADAARLVQIISNLLNNSAKYTDPGGTIWLTVTLEKREAVIRVRDTGRGIAPSLLPHIFDIFVQADRTLDRSEGGLGVGLTLVRSLVQQHGGSVTVHSDGPGQGCEFVIRLPVIPGYRFRSVEECAEINLPPGRRILVVDDNEDTAQALGDLLDIWGCETAIAYGGREALNMAQRFRPDAVLLDIGMPGMDGYQVARELRLTMGKEKLLLVALTGYGQEQDRKRGEEAGFDLHCVKPIDPEELRTLLATHLR